MAPIKKLLKPNANKIDFKFNKNKEIYPQNNICFCSFINKMQYGGRISRLIMNTSRLSQQYLSHQKIRKKQKTDAEDLNKKIPYIQRPKKGFGNSRNSTESIQGISEESSMFSQFKQHQGVDGADNFLLRDNLNEYKLRLELEKMSLRGNYSLVQSFSPIKNFKGFKIMKGLRPKEKPPKIPPKQSLRKNSPELFFDVEESEKEDQFIQGMLNLIDDELFEYNKQDIVTDMINKYAFSCIF